MMAYEYDTLGKSGFKSTVNWIATILGSHHCSRIPSIAHEQIRTLVQLEIKKTGKKIISLKYSIPNMIGCLLVVTLFVRLWNIQFIFYCLAEKWGVWRNWWVKPPYFSVVIFSFDFVIIFSELCIASVCIVSNVGKVRVGGSLFENTLYFFWWNFASIERLESNI